MEAVAHRLHRYPSDGMSDVVDQALFDWRPSVAMQRQPFRGKMAPQPLDLSRILSTLNRQ
jgi:hypothetical protein